MKEVGPHPAPELPAIYASLIENSPDLIAVVDRHYRYRAVNPAYSTRFGKSLDEIVGSTVVQLLGDDVLRNAVRAHLDRCFSGQPASYQGWFTYPTLGPRYMQIRYYPIQDAAAADYVLSVTRDITDQKAAEDALKDSEQRYRSLFESARALFLDSPDAVLIHEVTENGLPGRILEANQAAYRMLGLPKGRYPTLPLREIYRAMPRASRKEIFHELAARGQAIFETAIARKDGNRVALEVVVRPFTRSGQRIVVSILRDITERKMAEESLRESEERYRALADYTYDWEHWLGPDGRYVYVSPSCLRITGYRADEFRADPHLLEKIVHPDDRATVAQHLHTEQGENSGARELTFRILTRAGEERWINHLCQPIRGQDGSWMGWRGSNRDITEKEQIENSLRASEERFRRVFEDGPIGMAIVGPDRRFIRANQAFCQMMGYSEEDLREMRVEDITHPHDLGRSAELLKKLWRGDADSRTQLEKRYTRKNGQHFWGRLTATMLHGQHGEPTWSLAMLEDITEQREADQMREQYVSFVSHDLAAPLSVMIGQASIVRDRLAGKGLEPQISRIDSILKSAWRMNSMIQDLRETSNLESGRWKLRRSPTDLAELASSVCDHVVSPEHRARVQMEQVKDVPPVQVDRERLESAFANLITNALKYSPEDSLVTVILEKVESAVRVSVVDRGHGIPPEEQPLIFEQFYRATTRKKAEGLGLGLYIVRLIVEAHGGKVWLKSEVGKGSTFGFDLPISAA